jgi:hypothetical protein
MYEACFSKGGATMAKIRGLVQQGATGISIAELDLFFSKIDNQYAQYWLC